MVSECIIIIIIIIILLQTSIGTSWSKITAGNKPQTPPAPWGSNHTPNQATAPVFPPPTNSTASSSFWEECALDTVRGKKTSGNEGKGRGRERQGKGISNTRTCK